LSRHPFVYVDSGYVSDGQNPFDIHSRKVVMAQVRVPYIGLVNVFSAHLSWPSGGFYPQFARLQRWADERHSPEVAATLICGDFNIPAGSDAYRHIVDTGQYEDQYLKIVSPSVFRRVFRDRQGDAMSLLAQDGRIDYLWLRSGSCLRAIHAEELFTPERYGRVSDHTAYLVEFEPR
jgi:maltose 6'-phosphate phosphatase